VAYHLIELGADINCGSTDGCSPLCFAIMHSKTDIAKLLLEKGASPVGAEGAKWIPLTVAAMARNKDMAARWIEAGANPTVKNAAGQTASDVLNVPIPGQTVSAADLAELKQMLALQ
jgi:ankyrin repeat protein